MRSDFIEYWRKVASRVLPLPKRNLALAAFKIYFFTVFLHELSHHVIEDIGSALEAYNVISSYPFLSAKDEEPFCEYVAFSFSERWTTHPILHRVAPHLMKIEVRPSLRSQLLSVLYHHWNRSRSRLYRPHVTKGAEEKMAPIWNSFWRVHRYYGALMGQPPGEIGRRLFYTYQ